MVDLGIPGIGDATEIGVGASAQVFRARQLKLDRDVAIKLLNTTDTNFVRRFNREARTLGRLSRHEGIVTLYEFGETTAGQPYLMLEFCEESLLDRIQRETKLDPLETARISSQVAATLAAAHQADVIHRDIKPANILLGSTGRYLITDFGISTVVGSTSGHTSSVGFTAGYAAPETFEGPEHSGPKADVYALGATMFHQVTGSPPFARPEGDTNLLALIKRIVEEPVPDLAAHGVPDEVGSIIEQMLAKDHALRPDAETVAHRLAGLTPTAENPATVADPSGPPLLVVPVPVEHPAELTGSGGEEAPARRSAPVSRGLHADRRTVLVGLPILILVALLAAAAWRFFDGAESDDGRVTASADSGSEIAAGEGSASGEDGGGAEDGEAESSAADGGGESDGGDGDPASPSTSEDAGSASSSDGDQASSTSTTRTTTTSTTRPTTSTTSTTTTTTAAPTFAITSINGPSTVTCWDGNQTYTAVTTGGTATSWNWNTGALGLQSPFNAGPSAVLSFDLDPGVYPVTVTANGVSRTKSITVVSGPGCAAQAPNPVISGPASVTCGNSHAYSVGASNGVPLTSFAWSAAGPVLQTSASGQSVTIGYPVAAGSYQIRVVVNGRFETTRTVTVGPPDGGSCP